MSMDFIRDYELDVIATESITQQYVYLDGHAVTTSVSTGIEALSKFKMTANIIVSPNSDNSTSTITLYNIGADNMDAINSDGEREVVLRTRYLIENNGTGTFQEIYRGRVVASETKIVRNNVLTVLHCNAGVPQLAKQITNRVVAVGETPRAVMQYLANEVGVPLNWSATDEGPGTKKEWTIDASVAETVYQLCQKHGYNYFYGKEGITITRSIETNTGVHHTIPPSRVKGYPEVKLDFSTDGGSVTSKAPQIRVRTFLFGNIKIGDQCSVTIFQGNNRTREATFEVESFQFVLDSMDGDAWDCIMEGKEI